MSVQHRYLIVWEIAWTQYKSGSLALIDWQDWDVYLSGYITTVLPKEWWVEIRPDYKPKFAKHIDNQYAIDTGQQEDRDYFLGQVE